MNKCYLSTIEFTYPGHRSHFIIHSGEWYFAEFDTGAQLDFFCDTLGITKKEKIMRRYMSILPDGSLDNLYQEIKLSIDKIEDVSFWLLDEIPEKAKPIKALSNGSIVTCYYFIEKKVLYFYRPNPNATRNIYNPLSEEQHINHVKIYGLY